jgi:site-specific DNA-cytosine methylase
MNAVSISVERLERIKAGGCARPAPWDEAEVVQGPVKKVKEPVVLVRRTSPGLAGGRGEELVYLPGPPAISLFTGAGGFDIGLERAGFCVLAQLEWEASCCETLIFNRPDYFRHAALIQGDIRQTPTSMLLEAAGLRVGECHLVVGGPPCQGFTSANRHAQQHEYDERNDLVFEFLRVVREAQPELFIMENVPGIFKFNGGSYAEELLKRAYGSYYELVYGFVDAVEYKVPQHRTRFICMGTRRDLHEIDGMLGALPRPVCFGERTLRDVRAVEGAPLFDAELDRLTRAPGIRYFPDRPVLRPPYPVDRTCARSAAFYEFYDRLEREEPDRLVKEPTGARA